MATFVLVHGSWHGGWCWKRVAPLLREAGHEVYTPTLTGVGDRAHLLSPDTDLETHLTDVVKLLEFEELTEVVLVGHSYGGYVITGVAERVPDRIAHLVYLDALVPIDAERSLQETLLRYRPGLWHTFEEQMAASGGLVVPPPTTEPLMGLTDAADARWVAAHLTPHPAKTYTQRLDGDHTPAQHIPHTSIRCPPTAGDTTPSATWAGGQRIKELGGRDYEIPGAGHDVMVSRPRELADLLLAVAARS